MNRIIFKAIVDCLVLAAIMTVLLFTSCAPSLRMITGEKINSTCVPKNDLHIYSKYFITPKEYKVIDRIRTQGNLFWEYNLDQSMNLIRTGACYLGGNSLRIIDIISPSLLGSKSYDIIADVLSSDQDKEFDFSIIDNSLPVDRQFCYLKIYRSRNVYGSGDSYALYFGEEYVCSINNNSRITIKLNNQYPGRSFQIEFNGIRYPLQLNFEKGAVNFISCKVGNCGLPVLKILSDEEGIRKFHQ
jgi:hypothetical protein